MLDVDGGDHRDAGNEQLLDVLPAFRIHAARGVGVGQFVDQHHLRAAGQYRLDVEFGEPAAAVLDEARGDDLDAVQEFCGLRAAVRFDHRGHQVGTAFQPAVRLAEHGEGLADAGSCAQIDAQLPAFRSVGHLPIIHPNSSR